MRSETIIKRLAVLGLGLAMATGIGATPPAAPVAPMVDDPLRVTMLAAHNAARAQVGVPSLAWSPALAEAARVYAEDMARSGAFRHSSPTQRRDQGENLWCGSHGAFGYPAMAAAWMEEAGLFVNQPTPLFSATGRWQDVGHYSQIVWRSTTAVGCAMASSERLDYVVCRYGPAGNVIGRTAF